MALVEIDKHDQMGVIRLNRPEKHNAITQHMLSEIGRGLDDFEGVTELRAVILTGSGRSFSTGADLTEALEIRTATDYFKFNRAWRNVTYRLEHSSKPVIAAIGGYCLTGGCELAMACDLRIAAEDAQFGITSSKIGSVAGAGATQRLPRLVGPARAKELLFTAATIDAAEALSIGLVNRVVPPDRLLEVCYELVELLSQRGPLSLAWAKAAVNASAQVDLESGLDFEAALSSQSFTTQDKEEGMRAFLEKRAPSFRGQ